MNYSFSSLLPIKAADTVILDTDICPDCDDCGALAVVVHGCKSTGAKLGAVINNVDNIYGCGAIDAILSFYGMSAPIGMTTDKGFFANIESRYNRVLSEQFSENFRNGTLTVHPALELYRDTLKKADDRSVILITIGFLNTAAEILAAEPELFAAKVRCVVSMAGNFDDLSYHECNIVNQIPAAQTFFNTCPVPVFFNGFEIGSGMQTGFAELIPENPVSVAYDLYNKGYNSSFDPAAADFAFHGIGEDWSVSEPLTVSVNDDSTLSVHANGDGLHTTVRFTDEDAKERIRLRLNTVYSAPVK